jgi:hypothetical protein
MTIPDHVYCHNDDGGQDDAGHDDEDSDDSLDVE